MLNDVMTTKEAAEKYGLKENTVQLWCKGQKSLPPRLRPDECCKSGGVWLVTRQGIERLTNSSINIDKEETQMTTNEKAYLLNQYYKAVLAGRLGTLNKEDYDPEVDDRRESISRDLDIYYDGSPWDIVSFIDRMAEKFPQTGLDKETLRETFDRAEKEAHRLYEFLCSDTHARQVACNAEQKMFQ